MRMALIAFACMFLAGGVAGYFELRGAAVWLMTAGALGVVGLIGYMIGAHNVERRQMRREEGSVIGASTEMYRRPRH